MDLKAKIKDRWPEIAILAVAAAARLTLLGMKPPHFDEGVNGWFVDQLTQTGYYHYDPTNYHGPLHFYVLFLFQTLLGRHIWALRLPLAVMGVLSVWMMARFERFMGRNAALWAAGAMAISPGGVFYARYAIHEYWLVFALMLMAWGLAGLWYEGKRKYLWAVWSGVTLAVLTKETYVIHFAACALTFPCVGMLTRMSGPADRGGAARQEWTWRDMAGGAAMFVGCVVFFYSGAFMDVAGLKGLYQAYGAWAQTGRVGNGHEKPWIYWVKLMGRYEWPSCIGIAVGLATVWRGTPRFVRGIAIYGLGTLVAYSIIPYKTPWCIVSLTWPFLMLFGYGVDFAAQRWGSALAVGGAAVLAANAPEMVALNFFRYTDAKEPYVYVQTFPEVRLLMDPLNKLVAQNPENYQIAGHILMESYHPLPWLLGDFPNVGYYDEQNSPGKMDGDFLIVDEDRIDDVEAKLHEEYFTETFQLRDAQDPCKLYLNVKTFQSVFPGRKPDFVPTQDTQPDLEAKPDAAP